MRGLAVAQQVRDVCHPAVRVQQHPFRDIEAYFIQHPGVARALRREFALQTAFAQITQPRGGLYVESLFLNIGMQNLFE